MPKVKHLNIVTLLRVHGVSVPARTDGLIRALKKVAAKNSRSVVESLIKELAAAIAVQGSRRPVNAATHQILVPTKWLDLN